MNRNLKITFIGDITVDRPLINASRVSEKEYDFKPVFKNVKSLFEKSDYVVGNLETVFAGAKKGYNSEYMLVNAPDDLAKAIVYGGVDAVTTANNHCMDQGIKGVIRTLDILDNLGIDSYGTYRNKEEYNQIEYKDLDGTKIAIVAGTHSTNSTNIDEVIDEKNYYHVDVLKDQSIKYPGGAKGIIKKVVFTVLSPKMRRAINRKKARANLKKGIAFLKPRVDTKEKNDFTNEYFTRWIDRIDRAKREVDIVFACPHFGGQFNENPGEYGNELIDILNQKGVHVLGNHPHVVQKVVKSEQGAIGAYSIGGFNQSISGDYMNHDNLPQYSIAVNFYIDEKKVNKTTFSILKIVEHGNGGLEVYPVDKLNKELNGIEKEKLLQEVKVIYNRVTQKGEMAQIQSEYVL